MSADADLEETETEENAVEAGKKERKIYKGREVTLAELQEEVAKSGAVPIQPMVRDTPAGRLPPSFIATRFATGWKKDHRVLHFFVPKEGVSSYRELPEGFKLNILSGRRGSELRGDWDKAKTEKLHLITSKLGVTSGADPEIFALKTGKVLPAWEWVRGKDSRHGPDKWTQGMFTGTAYWDGFQAEWTTPPSIHCLMQLSDAIFGGLNKLHTLATKEGGKLSLKSVVEVDPDFLVKHAEKHPEHIAFGCSPSKNVYGLQGNIKDGKDVPYRFAGGHMHFGLTNKAEEHIKGLVKALDKVLGVATVSLFGSFDSPLRRQFYGLAGEYRTPPHGLEYRVLSNAWLSHPLAFHLCFDLARCVMGLQDTGFMGEWDVKEEEAVETIQAHDVERARKLLARNQGMFTGMFRLAQGAYLNNAQLASGAFQNGIESVVKDPENIEGNWHLGENFNHGNHMFASYVGYLAQKKRV